MAGVTLKNIDKIYDKNVKVVDDVNLEIRDHEFMVFVGPSGCGKSTTLRMIAGLEEISEGEIFIGGKKVNNVPPKDRDIAMVFQNYALYPHMTVAENMAFGLRLRKYPKPEIEARVKDAANILDLTQFLDRKPKALSGGQRQRVAVGRAIVRKPKVFLFDEPLSNLDAKLRVQMRLEISKLHQRLDTTMIYVTHDQVEAMTMGDRITVMKDGKIQQIDTPINVYNQPENKFVAGFIGSPAMNFFEGDVVNNGGTTFKSKGLSLDISSSVFKGMGLTTPMVLGVRPENISINAERVSKKLQKIEGVVDVIEPMGNEIIVYFSVDGKTHIMRTSPGKAPQLHEPCNFYIDSSKIHLFHSETSGKNKGTRINLV